MLETAFLSLASEDVKTGEFVQAHLEHHGVRTWMSSSLRPGKDWEAEIEQELASAEALLVAVSRNGSTSDWVRREVGTFLDQKEGPVVPMLFDGTTPAALDPELQRFQAIDFQHDILGAFSALLRAFGREFLPENTIIIPDRRSILDRRVGKDRRQSSVANRLRFGFWKTYQARMGTAKFEPVHSIGGMLTELSAIVLDEAKKYVYTDSAGIVVEPAAVLGTCADAVIPLFANEARGVGIPPFHVTVMEALVAKILVSYQVEAIDRRQMEQRHGA